MTTWHLSPCWGNPLNNTYIQPSKMTTDRWSFYSIDQHISKLLNVKLLTWLGGSFCLHLYMETTCDCFCRMIKSKTIVYKIFEKRNMYKCLLGQEEVDVTLILNFFWGNPKANSFLKHQCLSNNFASKSILSSIFIISINHLIEYS